MRLVFLDVDGVLNTATSSGGLEDHLVDELAGYVEDHQAHLVFSSTWRYGDSWQHVVEQLSQRGISPNRCLGATPDLSGVGVGLYPPSCSHECRTHEILLWLYYNAVEAEGLPFSYSEEKALQGQVEEHRFRLPQRVSVHTFVAIDDLMLSRRGCYAELADIAGRQVLTVVESGFNAEARQVGDEKMRQPLDFAAYCKRVFVPCRNPDCLHKEEQQQQQKKCNVH